MNKAHRQIRQTLTASHAVRGVKGFTLVEILVGLIIGLIGVLIIFQVFAVNEGQKRTTTSGSDAQQSGTFSLYTIERSIRSAGQNIMTTNHPDEAPILLSCNTRAFNAQTAAFGTFPMVPVLITSANDGTSDTIAIMSGGASGNSSPVNLTAAPGATDTLSVSNVFGFSAGTIPRTGDFFITMESGRIRPLVNCTLSQVTAVATTPPVAAPPALAGPGTIKQEFAGATASPYNAAFAVAYSKDAAVLNMGANPTFAQYSVVYDAVRNQSTLQVADLLGRAAPAVLAENIVNLQAQYGVDTNNDGTIDSWQPATAAWAAGAITRQQVTQIKAIRVGIVARSGLLEKVDPATNACNATPAPNPLPAVAGSNPAKPAGPAMSVAALPANWQCYRYKVYETVIPVRNAVMSAMKAL